MVRTLAFGLLLAVSCSSSSSTNSPSDGGAEGGAGTQLTVSKTVPASTCDGPITVQSVKAEDAGATIGPALTRVTVRGTTAGTPQEVLVYFETATGKVTSVTHTCAMNTAFCETNPSLDPQGVLGKACAGVTHDASNKKISLVGTGLVGTSLVACSSTLDGSIAY